MEAAAVAVAGFGVVTVVVVSAAAAAAAAAGVYTADDSRGNDPDRDCLTVGGVVNTSTLSTGDASDVGNSCDPCQPCAKVEGDGVGSCRVDGVTTTWSKTFWFTADARDGECVADTCAAKNGRVDRVSDPEMLCAVNVGDDAGGAVAEDVGNCRAGDVGVLSLEL